MRIALNRSFLLPPVRDPSADPVPKLEGLLHSETVKAEMPT